MNMHSRHELSKSVLPRHYSDVLIFRPAGQARARHPIGRAGSSHEVRMPKIVFSIHSISRANWQCWKKKATQEGGIAIN